METNLIVDQGIQEKLSEEAAEKAGWKELPACPFLVVDARRDLYCAYGFEKDVSEISENLNRFQFEDIGLGEGHNDALVRGLVKIRCSYSECPMLNQRLRRMIIGRLRFKRT